MPTLIERWIQPTSLPLSIKANPSHTMAALLPTSLGKNPRISKVNDRQGEGGKGSSHLRGRLTGALKLLSRNLHGKIIKFKIQTPS